MVVGAHALAAHGVARATGDIDILVRPNRENALRVLQALGAFGAPLANHGVGVAELATPGIVYPLGLPPRRIDILTAIDAVPFDTAWQGRVSQKIDGRQIPFLGKKELIHNKRSTGRARDLLDLALLEEVDSD